MRFEDLRGYGYDLPSELIRRTGVEPRDSARLFVYDTKTDAVVHDIFSNLANHLPEKSLMVLNDTRVVPARLWLRKETGGKIEVFVLANEWDGNPENVPVLVDRKCVPGMRLFFPDGNHFEVVRQEENRFFARLVFSGVTAENGLEQLLDWYGETPVPHYLEGDGKFEESELRKRYQTVFAKAGASVAAPTASLHFTERVFGSLDRKGIDIAKVTLDVGLGTFAPLREENFLTKKLHRERIDVSLRTADELNEAKRKGRPIIAVGTTALRTLETVVGNGEFRTYSGPTDIFIFPPHEFRSADALLTNFHLPETSLMLLVDAFLGWKGARRRIMPLYEEAIRERYAFYSFGDSMLII